MSETEKILDGSAKEVVKAIVIGTSDGSLDIDSLRLLHESESQSNKRQGVLAALARSMDSLANKNPATEMNPGEDAPVSDGKSIPESANTAEKSGKQSRGEETPDWQKPDYNGPLTCEKAEWRNKNIKQK